MLKNQGLKPRSILLWMGLALFAVTRPGLSTARDIPLPVDSNGNVVPHTFIRPGIGTGCAAYTFQEKYRWICEDNPEGDDRNEPIFRDENGVYKFTVYFGWKDSGTGTAPGMDKPAYYAKFESVSHWDILYTTREHCLTSPPSTINGWNVPGSSYTVSPCPAEEYTGPPLDNPWAKNSQQRQSYLTPAQIGISGDAFADGSSNYFQLSSLPLNPDVVAPLGAENTIINAPLDKSQNPIVEAEISYPDLNTASLDTTQGDEFVAPPDSLLGGGEYGFGQKEKRNSRAMNERRRKAVGRMMDIYTDHV